MTDFLMTPQNPPTAKIRLHPNAGSRNMLRAYRSSPQDINVQIRWAKGYASVALSHAEAKEFAEMILKAASELPEKIDISRGVPAHHQRFMAKVRS